VNSASADELATLPGVGPAISKEIIAGRPFKSVDDLTRVKGLTQAKVDAFRDKVKAVTPPPAKKININTATKADLETMPGIGPAKSQAIMDARPFKAVEDLKKVKGIGEATFEEIKDWVTIK